MNDFRLPVAKIAIPKVAVPNLYRMEELTETLAKHAEENIHQKSASGMHERIVNLINDFENDLDQELEAGVRLVSFGQTIQFHIQDVGYWNPNIIIFYGKLEDGSPVKLVQHMSQLSFLLVAMKRSNPETPRRKIGFAPDEPENQESDLVCD